MFTPQDTRLLLLFLAGCVLKSLICRDNGKIIKNPIHLVYLSIAVYLTPEKMVNYVEQLLVHVAKKADIKIGTKKNVNGCCRCSLKAA